MPEPMVTGKDKFITDEIEEFIIDTALTPSLSRKSKSKIHNLKCVCSYLSHDIRPNQLEHTLLRVPIADVISKKLDQHFGGSWTVFISKSDCGYGGNYTM